MRTPSEDLQAAIYQALIADPAVSAIVGDRVHDGRPDGYPCITFGPSDYVDDDAECITGRVETLQLDCWVRDEAGRLSPVKALADRVKAALHDAQLTLDTHALIILRVTAVRSTLDPDGKTGHGIVTLEADVEEL